MTIAEMIGEKAERELRAVQADATPKDDPDEPTPVVRVIKAQPLAPEARGRGWRRASGKLK